jgi:hypothetical protein
MQDELTAAGLNVTILGVNEVGHEAGNPNMCAGRDLPWLQETSEALVWDTWGITYRDVIILDGDNVVVAIYNVTEHNLGDALNYAELYGLFEAAANAN